MPRVLATEDDACALAQAKDIFIHRVASKVNGRILCLVVREAAELTAKALNHVAVSVTNINRAMRWYRDVLGMSVLAQPALVSARAARKKPAARKVEDWDSAPTPPHLSRIVRNVFGPRLGSFMICHLVSAEGVGVELFEFIEPAAQKRRGKTNFEYWKTGFFHLAITEYELEALAQKIASSGGKKRTEVMELFQGTGKKICFCEDPFGNIIEIYSHSYNEFWGVSAGTNE